MTPALLYPAALTALAALALPLVIHLARRTEQRLVDFAALRWLSPRPRPRRRPRLDEWPLLIARLLLLALLALWLATPVLLGRASRRPWVAVMPGLTARVPEGAQGHWLASGFPPLRAQAPTGRVPVTSLVRELDATLPPGVPLTVVVPAILSGVDAERPRLSRGIDWRVVPGAMLAPASVLPRPGFAVRGNGAGVRYLAAAARALTSPGDIGPADAPLPRAGVPIAWFVPGALPAALRDRVRAGDTVLLPFGAEPPPAPTVIVWRDATGTALVEQGVLGRGRVLRFVRPLTPAAMPLLLDAAFPGALARVLAPAPLPPSRVAAREIAPVPGGPAPERPPAAPLQPWLALLIAGVLLVERWLATGPRRGDAA